MDNTGNYITMGELLDSLYPSVYVSHRVRVQLNNKVGDQFGYVSGSFTPAAGDVICQGEYYATIESVGALPATITLDDATDIEEGLVWLYRSTLDTDYLDSKILAYMQIVDTYTGQWFNKRDITVQIEGSNNTMLHFSVPIIEVTSFKINDEATELDPSYYRVFSSRQIPDDRRNPKIKLLELHFLKNKLATIEGSWGWLEPDGTTPALIKRAMGKLIMMDISKDPLSVNKGQVRAEKTDIHEIHYAFTDVSIIDEISVIRTGDAEVDRILQMYRRPSSIGGTEVTYIKVNSSEVFEELYG